MSSIKKKFKIGYKTVKTFFSKLCFLTCSTKTETTVDLVKNESIIHPRIEVDSTNRDALPFHPTPVIQSPRLSPISKPLMTERTRNLTSLLSTSNMSNNEIVGALLVMDNEEKLRIDIIEQLLKYIPTYEERTRLNQPVSNLGTLSRADDFLYGISTIPRYEQRLKTILLIKKFATRMEETATKIVDLKKASKEVARCKKLKELLNIALSPSHKTNGKRQLDDSVSIFNLNQLAEIRSIKNVSLLHYLVDFLETKRRDLLNLQETLPYLKYISQISVSALENDMKRLHRDLQATEKEVIYYSSKHGPADKIFVQVVDEFLTPATSRLFKLQKKFDSMKKSVTKLIRSFGEDPLTTNSTQIFDCIDFFLNSIQRVRIEKLAIKKWSTYRFSRKIELRKKVVHKALINNRMFKERPGRGKPTKILEFS